MEKKAIKKTPSVNNEKPITRKEAIKKAGLVAASVATTMILLGTPKTASASPCTDHSGDENHNHNHNHNNENEGGWRSNGQ